MSSFRVVSAILWRKSVTRRWEGPGRNGSAFSGRNVS